MPLKILIALRTVRQSILKQQHYLIAWQWIATELKHNQLMVTELS
jgi:hypothetical protein